MRKSRLLAAAIVASLVAVAALSRGACADGLDGCACDTAVAACGCAESSGGGVLGGGLLGGGRAVSGHHVHLHRLYDGADLHFNCGCNGSYKFPVPPLYTYFWPGMYSQELMTDYHYPKRFPPLKPYTEEPDPVRTTSSGEPATLRPISALAPLPETRRAAGIVPMSERLLQRQ
jgi:hypothetical protein